MRIWRNFFSSPTKAGRRVDLERAADVGVERHLTLEVGAEIDGPGNVDLLIAEFQRRGLGARDVEDDIDDGEKMRAAVAADDLGVFGVLRGIM
jgi:hypothetical protein